MHEATHALLGSLDITGIVESQMQPVLVVEGGSGKNLGESFIDSNVAASESEAECGHGAKGPTTDYRDA
jgi:hypothetical protein|tara:strand:- start:822 stop:1028 length:207 start_codon:yes stop_codon:yes gene_type:complete